MFRFNSLFISLLVIAVTGMFISSCSKDDDKTLSSPTIEGKWSLNYLATFNCPDTTLNSVQDLRFSDCLIKNGEELCYEYIFDFKKDGLFESRASIQKVQPDGTRVTVLDFGGEGTYTLEGSLVTVCEDFGSLGIECIDWEVTLSENAITLLTAQVLDNGCREEMRGIRTN